MLGDLLIMLVVLSPLVATLIFLIRYFTKSKPIPKITPSITLGGYEADGQWVVPTRYAAAFKDGERGAATTTLFDPERTNPRFGVTPEGQGEVQWFRAVAPLYTWEKHSLERRDDGSYVDTKPPPIITARTPTANGALEGKWNARADAKKPAWTVPTRYRARYGVGNAAGPWSEASEAFASDVYTAPSLRVEAFYPLEVQWQRSVGPSGSWEGHAMTRQGDVTFVDTSTDHIPAGMNQQRNVARAVYRQKAGRPYSKRRSSVW